MLTFDLLAKIAFIIDLFFMGSLSGVFSMLVTFFYLIAANIKEKRNRRWTLAYVLFQLLLICIMLMREASET